MDTDYFDFAALNRKKLLHRMPKNSIALFLNLNREVKNQDAYFPHSPNPNFFYVTGTRQPNSALLLVKEEEEQKEAFFLEPRDRVKEIWEGKMLDFREVSQTTGIRQVLPISNLKKSIFVAQKKCEVFWIEYEESEPESSISKNLEFLNDLKYRLPGINFQRMMPQIEQLRSQKSNKELDYFRRATEIFSESFRLILSKIKPGVAEFEIQAELEGFWKKHNASPGFDTIVAGGKNALCLHYTTNQETLRNGELVLIDAGCNYQGYSCDVTRTLPINGRFSDRQAEIYESVLTAQKEIIQSVRVGMNLKEVNEAGKKILFSELKKIGLLESKKEIPEIARHSIGHSLGLDVHDPINPNLPLGENALITIEPGVYLEKEEIGIRIEDDLLLKSAGNKILTESIPKEIKEIESAMEK